VSAHRPASLPIAYGDRSQRDAANDLGMWTFIATEILFFSGLFLAYFIYRTTYPAGFAAGSRELNFWRGTLNTLVLLTSSLTMALSDAFVDRRSRTAFRVCLASTALLGTLFLVIKFSEYHEMFAKHLVPGLPFAPSVEPSVKLFALLYFIMTGVHAVHMLAGLGTMSWLFRMEAKGEIARGRTAPVRMFGLYWHFVDCVWVFLYPLLYLIPSFR
jgi:cytochrome c oxidase subunit 3